jgi:hypothetical protein
MSRMIQSAMLLAGLMLATASWAQAPAGAPAGATGLCKDGTYWTNPTKKGACHGHQGIQTWYATTGASSSSGGSTASTPAPAASPPPAPPPAAPAAPTKTVAAPPAKTSSTPAADAAPGGGPGLVWVNSSTKVYHCLGDRWYGKTKNGAYMSEAAAKAQGDRPDHGKACSSS